jgi:hypothetical protein
MSSNPSVSEVYSLPEAKSEAISTKNDLLATAQRSIQASRSDIAKLIDATPLDDHYTLEMLGPILAELRAAESILNAIETPYNA